MSRSIILAWKISNTRISSINPLCWGLIQGSMTPYPLLCSCMPHLVTLCCRTPMSCTERVGNCISACVVRKEIIHLQPAFAEISPVKSTPGKNWSCWGLENAMKEEQLKTAQGGQRIRGVIRKAVRTKTPLVMTQLLMLFLFPRWLVAMIRGQAERAISSRSEGKEELFWSTSKVNFCKDHPWRLTNNSWIGWTFPWSSWKYWSIHRWRLTCMHCRLGK